MWNQGRELFNKVRQGHWTPFLWLAQQQEPSGTATEQLLRLVEERAVTEVVTKYAYYYDASDVDRVMSLFTDDAVVVSNVDLISARWIKASNLQVQTMPDAEFVHEFRKAAPKPLWMPRRGSQS